MHELLSTFAFPFVFALFLILCPNIYCFIALSVIFLLIAWFLSHYIFLSFFIFTLIFSSVWYMKIRSSFSNLNSHQIPYSRSSFCYHEFNSVKSSIHNLLLSVFRPLGILNTSTLPVYLTLAYKKSHLIITSKQWHDKKIITNKEDIICDKNFFTAWVKVTIDSKEGFMLFLILYEYRYMPVSLPSYVLLIPDDSSSAVTAFVYSSGDLTDDFMKSHSIVGYSLSPFFTESQLSYFGKINTP